MVGYMIFTLYRKHSLWLIYIDIDESPYLTEIIHTNKHNM